MRVPVTVLFLLLFGCGGGDAPAPDAERSLQGVPATKLVVTGSNPTPPPSRTPVGTDALDADDPTAALESADRVLVADLHGDGTPEVFVASGNRVHWGEWPEDAPSPAFTSRHEGKGMLQTWLAHDLDGDGRQEVLLAFGMGRGFANAEGRVVLVRGTSGGSTAVPAWRFKGPRTQVTSLQPWPRKDGTFDVYVAAFEDRFHVRGGVMPRDGGEPTWLEGHSLRMGMYRAVADFDGDGAPETAIGRLYGDEKGKDGDLRVVHHDGVVDAIPTVRGVRAVGAGDVDGDGRPELLFGDGWHKNYGKAARYRPSVARWRGGWTTALVEESADQYAVEKIGVAHGRIVAGGNRWVSSYVTDAGVWNRVGEPAPTTPTGTWSALPDGTVVVGGRLPKRVSF